MSRRAGLVKASTADLDGLGISDGEAFMASLVADGAELAVLTAAENGATAMSRTTRVHVPSKVRKIVDTVGAGDAFMVGLLHNLQAREVLAPGRLAELSEGDLSDALGVAQAAAAFTCASKGAVMPGIEDLEVDLESARS